MKQFAKCLLIGLLFCLAAGVSPAAVAEAPRVKPNFVFILTDDLDTGYPQGNWIENYPRLKAIFQTQGITFVNHFVSLSLCCPSRVTMLRGQYAHNTGVVSNEMPYGGFVKAHNSGLEKSTVAVWLQSAGYRTAMIGKYLNHYMDNSADGYYPPGWSEWYGGDEKIYRKYNYTLNENGSLVKYGDAENDYLEDVLAGKVTDFIRRHVANHPNQPFFVWFAPTSPHSPATPAPRHMTAFPNAQLPRGNSYNQDDIHKYPSWIQTRSRLSADSETNMNDLYQRRLRSMLAVEDAVANIVDTLRQTGALSNTYLAFTSDNGFHMGQHRLSSGKWTEFEEDLRVPLMIRGPGVPAGKLVSHITVNTDFAPTFADLAGVQYPAFVDGRSLRPLLRPNPPPPNLWRQGFLAEIGPGGDVPTMQGVHTGRYAYFEYPIINDRELYDLRADPYELNNLAGTARKKLMKRLSRWTKSLAKCAGEQCRYVEDHAVAMP